MDHDHDFICHKSGCWFPYVPVRKEEYTRDELDEMANADCRFLDPETRVLLPKDA